MPAPTAVVPDAGENSPTKLVLFAAVRTIVQYQLPCQGKLRRLLRQENDVPALHAVIKEFAALAAREVAAREQDTPGGDDPSVVLARHAVAATTMAWKVRAVAQGVRPMAPSDEAWTLFALITTVVYHRARTDDTVHTLVQFIHTVAEEISEL